LPLRSLKLCSEQIMRFMRRTLHYSNDVVPDHKQLKGMGGAWRDDHADNIQATHWWCSQEKGSTRIAEQLTKPSAPVS